MTIDGRSGLSGYRIMWLLVLFDLPTKTKREKKAYVDFRKKLLEDGYTMMQYSVYTRVCPSQENLEVHIRRLRAMLPEYGQVRVLTLTDRQFGRMRVFQAGKLVDTESPPSQLTLF